MNRSHERSIWNSSKWYDEVTNSEKPVFVDFWAERCGPCRMGSPVIEELSKEFHDKVNFVKVNVEDNSELTSKYNVFSILTLAIIEKGKVMTQTAGASSKDSLKKYIDNHLFVN